MVAEAQKTAEQRREAVRIDVDRLPIEVWISRLMAWERVPGQILNISAGGALIELAHPLPVGIDVHCRFDLTDQRLFSLSTTVMRVATADTNLYHMGMRFDFSQEGRRDVLVRWVFEEIARRHRTVLEHRELSKRQQRLKAARR